MERTILSERHYRRGDQKEGYVVRTELVSGVGDGSDVKMKSAYTPSGDYIGDSRTAYRLCIKKGIKPEKAQADHCVCSIGFSEADQKWYGWSHRAIYGFGVGDTVKEGDCCASSGWIPEYLAEHPDEDRSLPVGFTAKSLSDARRMAVAFAESVS